MQALNQSDYNICKALLELLKQKAKEHPNYDQKLQTSIINSHCKQDYIEITDRIGLTKKTTSNNLIELVSLARTAGKYGPNTDRLDDPKYSCQEKLRVYLIDSGKYLKEVSQLTIDIWKTFKKIKDNLSQFQSKNESQNGNIKELLLKIKSFKSDIEDNKYSISKVGSGSFIKVQAPPSYVKQNVQKIQDNKQLQMLRVQIQELVATPASGKDIQKYQTDKALELIKNKLSKLHENQVKIIGLTTNVEQLKAKLQQSRKKQKTEEAPSLLKKDSSFSNTTGQLKQNILNLLIKILQTRKISELKIIEREIESITAKKIQFLQLKNSLKNFIRDQQQAQPQPSSLLRSYSHGTGPENQKQKILTAQIKLLQAKLKQIQTQKSVLQNKLRQQSKQHLHAKSQVATINITLAQKVQHQFKLEKEIKSLQSLNNQLKSQLEQQRVKFSHLQHSTISLTSQDTELINYQDLKQYSPLNKEDNISHETPTNLKQLKNLQSPTSEPRTEVMLDCLQQYQELQQKLRSENSQLNKQNSIIVTERNDMQSQIDHFFIELATYKHQIEKQQKQQISKSEKILELQKQIRSLNIKNSNILKPQEEKRQIKPDKVQSQEKSFIDAFFIEQKKYQAKIKLLQQQKEEYKKILDQFWIEKHIYQGKITQLSSKIQQIQKSERIVELQKQIRSLNIKNSNLIKLQEENHQTKPEKAQSQEKSFIDAFFIEHKNYQQKIKLLHQQKQEYRKILDQFWIEKQTYQGKIDQLSSKVYESQQIINQLQKQKNTLKSQSEKHIAQLQQTELKLALTQGVHEQQNKKVQSQHSQPKGRKSIIIDEEKYNQQLKKQTEDKAKLHQLQHQFNQFFINQGLFKQQLKKKMLIIQQLNSQLQKNKKQIANLKTQLQQATIIPNQFQLNLSQIHKITSSEKMHQNSQSQQYKIHFSRYEAQIVRLKQQVDASRFSSFFNFNILEKRPSQKQKLTNLLMQQTGKHISNTKLIYKYDIHNTASFHKYIDHVQNIVMLVQTKEAILGGYYAGSFQQGKPADKEGFIFSLNLNECFLLKPGRKAITYDIYFIIFGNSELRIRPDQQLIFSNLGIANAYFDSKGKKVNDFLREGNDRQIPMINLQFYQLIFEQASPQHHFSLKKTNSVITAPTQI